MTSNVAQVYVRNLAGQLDRTMSIPEASPSSAAQQQNDMGCSVDELAVTHEQDQQRVRRRMERFLAGQLDLNPATPEPNYADAAPESNGHIMAPALPKPSRLAPDLPNGAHASPAGSCAER